MFYKRATLFHFFGFKVQADASWLFLSVLISWMLSSSIFPQMYPGHDQDIYQLMGVATLAGLIFSIIAHEVAHAVIAEYYHMPIESITLFVFGGVAEMHGEPSHPKGEFLMAVAGPVMSGLMGLFFAASAMFYAEHIESGPVAEVLGYLGQVNFFLAGFNLIPAFPLDGGRALRAVIWYMKNNLVLATRIASEAGAIFAYGLLAWACYKIVILDDLVSGIWIGLLGFFMHGSGAYAVRQVESRSLLGQENVSRFLQAQVVTVSPDLTITDLVDNYVYKHYQRIFPVVDRDILVGVVFLQDVLSLDRHKWPWLHVSSVMAPLNANIVVAPETSAADALELMQRQQSESLMVAKERKFIGIVAFRDLAAYLAVSMRVDHNRPVSAGRRGR